MSITLPYRIMAIDPAATKSGWAILDILSLYPLEINIVKTGQLDGAKLVKQKTEMAGLFTFQFCTVQALEDEYKRLIVLYGPSQVVSEGSFQHLFVSAMVSLTLVIDALRRASYAILNKDITTIPPTISKKSATGSGGADKDLMRLAYQTCAYLTGIVSDDQISEHEIDAIWHGVAWVKVHVLGVIKQISAKEKRQAKLDKAEKKKAASV